MTIVQVLVVDDDPAIRKLLHHVLEQHNYKVHLAANGMQAIDVLQSIPIDFVILDLVMPDMSGYDVCKWIRDRWDIPILVLSARSEEDWKVQAFDVGADDYVTKPFAQNEFLARIRALIRRSLSLSQPEVEEDFKVQIEGLLVNLKARRVFVDDADIRLTRTEFALLSALALNLDSVLTHEELLVQVWGKEYIGSSHYLHVYFGRIRKKMGEEYSVFLESVPGMGYILRSSRAVN